MRKHQAGVALVEFALILPLLIVLSVITTEFGRAIYQYNIVTKSVRDASRYLSVQDPTIATTDPAKVTIAKNLVVYGIPSATASGPPLVLGLSTAEVLDPTWATAGTNPLINTVTITVKGCANNAAEPCFKFVPLFTSVFGVNIGVVNYGNISATMRAPL